MQRHNRCFHSSLVISNARSAACGGRSAAGAAEQLPDSAAPASSAVAGSLLSTAEKMRVAGARVVGEQP